jgi:pantoate--beta-alanine ligase
MKAVCRLEDLRAERSALPDPLGLVPTMGALHDGHLSLVRRARAECASVAVSIFVNPTQFGPHEDLQAYPRDLPGDLAMLDRTGADLVWTPEVEDIYPPGDQTWVTVEAVTSGLEGARRPGHFRGVATVVTKLLHAFEPQRAYFGQKDAQQAVVIQQMARDLLLPVEIVVCPTVREADGLAMSSRNRYLSPDERRSATVLYRALCAASSAFGAGERDAERLRRVMREVLSSEPKAHPHYVSAADPETLEESHGQVDSALLSMAVALGDTTLIDNLVVGGGQRAAGREPLRSGGDPCF